MGYDSSSRARRAAIPDAAVPSTDSGPGAGGAPSSGGSPPFADASTYASGGGGAGSTTASFDAAIVKDAFAGADAVVDATHRDAGPACRLAPQDIPDLCLQIPELPAPAAIDGELECGLSTRSIVPVDYSAGGTPDATIDYAIAWSDGGLYFFASVHDPHVIAAEASDFTWQGDSVEFYVDSDGVYGAPPAYDAATRQLIIAAPSGDAPSTRGETYAVPPTGTAWTSTRFAAYRRSFGYVVEAVVTAEDVGLASWPLVAGGRIGFDVGLNLSASSPDGGTQGNRIGQFFLNVDSSSATGHPFQSVTAFCNPALVARSIRP